MRPAHLIIFILALGMDPAAMAAVSCVQNTGSATFRAAHQKIDQSANQQNDCVLPEKWQRTPMAVGSDMERTVATSDQSAQSSWELRVEDGSVYAALKRWSLQVGWQVSWEIPVDFPIEIVDVSMGSFEDSVRRVLTAFKVADYPPHPCFHQNKVIRVVRRIQGNDDECR